MIDDVRVGPFTASEIKSYTTIKYDYLRNCQFGYQQDIVKNKVN